MTSYRREKRSIISDTKTTARAHTNLSFSKGSKKIQQRETKRKKRRKKQEAVRGADDLLTEAIVKDAQALHAGMPAACASRPYSDP